MPNRLFFAIAIIFIGCAAPPPPPRIAPAADRPKLLVLIVFDQMRGDYLARWADLYPDRGFKRLMSEGMWFTDCHFPYAATQTGPGHASFLTGCSPDRHGIVANDWYERPIGKTVYCATSDRTELVYTVPRPVLKAKEKLGKGGTPERMLATGVADWLKEQTGGRSKVVALSLKDRSACTLGGNRPDACYWFDLRTGTFVTSTWYRDRCHDWVAVFNARRPADGWLGKQWMKSRPDIDYEKHSGPDEVAVEAPGVDRKMGRSFPHPLSIGKPKPDKEYYDEVTGTPFGNDLLLDFAKAAFVEMQLGQGEFPDLLTVSFSSMDIVGHAFGPDSQEMLDTMLNADRAVAQLLDLFDARVGKGKYLVALSSDHGICPIPELAAARGLGGRRLKADYLRKPCEDYLNEKYGVGTDAKSKWFDAEIFPWVYLNHRKLAARKLDPAAIASELAELVRNQSWASAVFTRADLATVNNASDPVARRVKKSFHPGRSGDFAVVLKPYHTVSDYMGGTSHGSPHPYDTHVPLVFFGPGMPAERSAEVVTPQCIAAVFARAAGVTPAATLDASVPAACFTAGKSQVAVAQP